MERLYPICGLDSQIATSNDSNTTNPSFKEQAEKRAFLHVKEALRDMPWCRQGDLVQAAKSYFYQSLREQGAAHLFREAEVEERADRYGAWWTRKHRDIKTPRPHTVYTPSLAKLGNKNSAISRGNDTDWSALRAQLMRRGGSKVREVAAEFGCDERNVYRWSKRKFSRLVAVVFCWFVNMSFANSSSVPTNSNWSTDLKEPLANVTLGAEQPEIRPATPSSDADLDELDAENVQVWAELAALYPHRAADLELFAS